MQVFLNDKHALHHGRHEMFRGALVPCFEIPARNDYVLQELQARGGGTIRRAPEVELAVLERVHAPRYLHFLATAWDEWVALDPANSGRDAPPSYWPIRTFRGDVLPASFPARLGLFSFDAGSPLTAGTWAAARQDGDPHAEYPYFLGYADERGAGAGEGCNLNLPLPRGTGFPRWREALAEALRAVGRFGAQALVVSLGVDTFEGDPISGFGLRSEEFPRVGEDLAAAGLPTLFVFEGGYAVAQVGVNADDVLKGFAQRAG